VATRSKERREKGKAKSETGFSNDSLKIIFYVFLFLFAVQFFLITQLWNNLIKR
jgi:hypothetical protein